MTTPTISAAAVHAVRVAKTPCWCIDVRTPLEHRGLHAEGVELIPLDRLTAADIASRRPAGMPIYVFCRSGGRATQAVQRLIEGGVADCHVVTGGTEAWAAAGLPVVHGKVGMSLERQVRIAAGGLVVAGAALGTWVHPGLYGICAFVGAGLIFAGVTDWCGMGMVLARMPWNRVAAQATTCATKA